MRIHQKLIICRFFYFFISQLFPNKFIWVCVLDILLYVARQMKNISFKKKNDHNPNFGPAQPGLLV